MTTVDQIMTPQPVTVKLDTSLAEIKQLFENHEFHHLPVVNNGNQLAGIISRKDLQKTYQLLSSKMAAATLTKIEPTFWQAHNIMTAYPLALAPDDTVGLAADIFLANKFHALPIVDDGELLGIVTSHDLLTLAFSQVLPNE
ncbi:MAG: CBS domain-containing protein [Bacteroidota bacterium]